MSDPDESTRPFLEVNSIEELLSSQRDARLLIEKSAETIFMHPHSIVSSGLDSVSYNPNRPLTFPDQWWEEKTQIPELVLYKLKYAIFIPGMILKQGAISHEGGQLLLRHNGELFSESSSILDGNGTLPIEYVENGLKFYEDGFSRVDGCYYFLGSLHRHFGHILLEGLSRLWPLVQFADSLKDHKFVCYEGIIPKFASEFFSPFGIDRNFERLTKPSVIENLIVPSPSYSSHRWGTNAQKTVWKTIENYYVTAVPRATEQKLFLSRSGQSDRKLANEPDVEKIFAQAGYSIVKPETLSVPEQILAMNGAKVVAGCVGSALYLRAFSSSVRCTRVLAPRNFFLKDDLIIARLRGGELTVGFGTAVDNQKTRDERVWNIDLDVARQVATDEAIGIGDAVDR